MNTQNLKQRLNGISPSVVKRIAAAGVIGLASLVSGCSSDSGVEFDLISVKLGHQQSTYRKTDNRTPTDLQMFEKDCNPYDKSQITDNAGFFEHYKIGTDGWKNYKKQE